LGGRNNKGGKNGAESYSKRLQRGGAMSALGAEGVRGVRGSKNAYLSSRKKSPDLQRERAPKRWER